MPDLPSGVDYELALLKYSFEQKDIDLDPRLFSEERRDLFRLFRKYYDEYKDLPNSATIKALIKDYQLDVKLYDIYSSLSMVESIKKEYCINQLQDEYFERVIKRGIGKYNTSDKKSKKEKYEEFINYLMVERADVSEMNQGFVWESAPERWDEFEKKSEAGLIMEGTPTHICPFDEHLGGAVDGRFNVVMGLPKAGKSTVLMNIADNLATLEDEDVIFVSGEMPKRSLEIIIDAKRSMLNSRLIRNGSLSETLRQKYAEILEEQWKKKSRLYIIEPAIGFTTGDVLSYIRVYEKKYKPKKRPKVIIDYLWKMETERRYSGSWDKLDYVTEEIYELLCRKLGYNVWSATHEGLEGHKRKRDKKERGSEGVQGSSRILPNVSALIMMDTFYGEEELTNKMLMKCDEHSNRHGEPFSEYVTYLREFSYVGSDSVPIYKPKKKEIKKVEETKNDR